MNFIQKLQAVVARQQEVIQAQEQALDDLRDYANSPKFNRTEQEPIPVMNPQDVVLRVRDWTSRIHSIALNGTVVTDDLAEVPQIYNLKMYTAAIKEFGQ